MTARAAIRRPVFLAGSLTFAAVLAACISMTTAMAQESLPDYTAIIAAPDRTEADLQTDKRRDPLKLLTFAGARPGMKVLDMGAGRIQHGIDGPCSCPGWCGGQNPADLGERAKTRFEARLTTAAGKNIVSLVRPFDDPVTAEVRDLDLIRFLFSITIPLTWPSIAPR
jgi:predicted methyltransferase